MRVVYKALSAPLLAACALVGGGRGGGASGLLPPEPAAWPPTAAHRPANAKPGRPKRPAADYMDLPTASAPAGRVIPCASSRIPAAGAALLASCALGRPAPGNRTRARPALWRFASIENGRCGPRAWRAGARPGSGAAEDGERHGGEGDRLLPLLRLKAARGVPRPRLPSSRAGDARRGRTRRGASWAPSPRRAPIPAACTTPRASTAGKYPGPCAAATAKAGRSGERRTIRLPRLEKGAAGRPPPRRACRSWTARPTRSTTNARPVQEMRRPRVRRAQGALCARRLAGAGSRRAAARGCLPGAAGPLATRCLAAGELGTRGPRAPQGGGGR